MFWTKRVVIGDGERGLVYRNRQFERVLEPGVHRFVDPFKRIEVRVFDAASALGGAEVDVLIERLGGRLDAHFTLADIGVDRIGLLLRHGKVEDVLVPGTRRLYGRASQPVEIRTLPLAEDLAVPSDVAMRLRQLGVLGRFAVMADVPVQSIGLLFVDATLQRTLAPGAYAFWNVQKNVAVEVIDLRQQPVEVSGQELLTRDKVSLRVNLAATVRVVDAVAARTEVAKFMEQVYRELQYGLRKAVASKTLDELLGDKASLDADIFAHVRGKVAAFGVEVLGVGVKDVILPGEMKAILNSVVQAEKAAQAQVIRRREEANATRSLLNTAKLIEGSPVLMRLKELEALEKVTEKIDTLTVYGGLDGVLNQLVTIKQ